MPGKFDYQYFTDAYFLRSLKVLQAEGLNPYVRYQVFFRGEPGVLGGVEEAIAFLQQNTKLRQNGGRIFALSDGASYTPGETVMVIEGFAQDLITTETVLLGILSSKTTLRNGGSAPGGKEVRDRMASIVSFIGGRSVMYFGARHFHYEDDERISRAAFEGGASDCSTDSGSSVVGRKGVGTIPHALECIFAWKYGMDKAVLESTKAFDRAIPSDVPRIALIDFSNREIDDSLRVAEALGERLFGVRVDTAGENEMQGQEKIAGHEADPYWFGKGVTVGGVSALKKALDSKWFSHIKIVLSSGFGNPEKVKTFVDAERELGIRLFDTLGVGEVGPGRFATMDIVGVGNDASSLQDVSKVGRVYRRNLRLKEYF